MRQSIHAQRRRGEDQLAGCGCGPVSKPVAPRRPVASLAPALICALTLGAGTLGVVDSLRSTASPVDPSPRPALFIAPGSGGTPSTSSERHVARIALGLSGSVGVRTAAHRLDPATGVDELIAGNGRALQEWPRALHGHEILFAGGRLDAALARAQPVPQVLPLNRTAKFPSWVARRHAERG